MGKCNYCGNLVAPSATSCPKCGNRDLRVPAAPTWQKCDGCGGCGKESKAIPGRSPYSQAENGLPYKMTITCTRCNGTGRMFQ